MKMLVKAMAPLRRRIRRIRLHRGLAVGACVGLALCLGATVASFLMPIRHLPKLWAALLLSSMLVAGLVCLLAPVTPQRVAYAGDAWGLQERLQTALSLAGDTPMEQLQHQDALQALRNFSVKTLPLPKVRRLWWMAAALTLACASLCLIPNPQAEVLAQAEAFEKAMEEAAASVEEISLGEALSESQRQEVRRLVDDLSRQLRQAREPVEAMLAISQAEERLESLQQRMAGETQSIMESALQAQGLDALAQALSSGDDQQVSQALTDANAQAMESAAQQLSGNMQEQLQQAAQAMQTGDISTALAQLSQMTASGQSSALAQLTALSQELSGLRSLGAAAAGQKGNGSGFHAGRGETNEDQTAQAEDTPGSRGSDNPRRREGEYERIYDPTRLDAEQVDLTAQSDRGEGEAMQAELAPGAGSLEGTVPYNQVALDYAQAASQAADSQSLTAQERQWVTDYFTALTE